MPILESLQQNFDTLSHEERVVFLRAYRKRRAEDLKKPPTYGSKASTERNANIRFQTLGLTPEEIELAKTLGLKPADLIKLKESANAS